MFAEMKKDLREILIILLVLFLMYTLGTGIIFIFNEVNRIII